MSEAGPDGGLRAGEEDQTGGSLEEDWRAALVGADQTGRSVDGNGLSEAGGEGDGPAEPGVEGKRLEGVSLGQAFLAIALVFLLGVFVGVGIGLVL